MDHININQPDNLKGGDLEDVFEKSRICVYVIFFKPLLRSAANGRQI